MHNQRSILGNYLQESVIRQIRELNTARTARIDALYRRQEIEKWYAFLKKLKK